MTEKTKILLVTAHPDDETFGMGGTIAKYQAEGVAISVICATKGEVGEADADLLAKYDSMADLRVAEMRCAMQVLGVSDYHFLGYRDSGMPGSPENNHPQAFIQAPLEKTGLDIAFYLRKIRPNVVLTSDPMGGYGHPDHIHAYQSVVKALELAADPDIQIEGLEPFHPEGIFLQTFPRGFMRVVVKLMPLFGKDPTKFGKNGDINFVEIMQADFPIHVRIHYGKYTVIREKASACYRSQGGDQQSGFFISWLERLFSSTEGYMQYYPEPQISRIRNDFFTKR
ncbi:MAG: PIG-L family deacetylase [Anaerolineaceae bacterium]